MEGIYKIAADIASQCKQTGLESYPDDFSYEYLTPDGGVTVSYDFLKNRPTVSVDHADPDNRRPLPNITAVILQELPDVLDIEEEYFEERKEYYRAGYPEETTTNAEFFDMKNL